MHGRPFPVPVFIYIITKIFDQLWYSVCADRLVLTSPDLDISGPEIASIRADPLKGKPVEM